MLTLILGWVLLSVPAMADERILRFHSDITVHQDATVTVIETIQVRSEGDQIRRGIFRDIPLSYRDRLGKQRQVTLDVVSITRDGELENYQIERPNSSDLRIRIGSASVLLQEGVYTYAITYQTTRQVGYFDDFDELYWNVTGNGWAFPIDEASAMISLPPRSDLIASAVYTGSYGSTDSNAVTMTDHLGRATFRTTQALGPYEGMTVAASWPKGAVAEPSQAQTWIWFFEDNAGLVTGVACFLLILLYYLTTWAMFGIDPARGMIRPRLTPPSNVSPAVARYVRQMNYDDKIFAIALTSLGTKGFLRIVDDDDDYRLEVINREAEGISEDEAVVADWLFDDRDIVDVKRKNILLLQYASRKLHTHLETIRSQYFERNFRFVFGGVVLTFVSMAIIAIGSDLAFEGYFMAFWLTGWTIGVFSMVSACLNMAVSAIRDRSPGNMFGALFVGAFSVPFIFAELAVAYIFTEFMPLPVMGLAAATIALTPIFYKLLKAPTAKGSELWDRLDGFKLALQASKTDSPFDRGGISADRLASYLPYAMALDVETGWNTRLKECLASTSQDSDEDYVPSWYHGTRWHTAGPTAILGSMQSSIRSASTSPSSSSSSSGSSGGGFSGGGGGGGGGGGW